MMNMRLCWKPFLTMLLVSSIPAVAQEKEPGQPAPIRVGLWNDKAPLGDGTFEEAEVTITMHRAA